MDPAWGKLLPVGFFAFGVCVAVRVSAPLKRVHLVRGGLHASNYLRTIRVPWRDVEHVVLRGSFGRRSFPVVEMKLRRRGAFGSRIALVPASPEALELLEESAAAAGAIPWERR